MELSSHQIWRNSVTWEAERYDWSRLRAMGSASGIPGALAALQSATSEQDARSAYWKIDNTVIVQGALYEAALPTTACAVSVLARCTSESRPWCLELLVQLGSGQPEPSELEATNGRLQELCAQELSRGFSLYLDFLENGTEDERESCVDLLGLCARSDTSLRARVNWYLNRLLREELSEGLRQLTENWLQEFTIATPN